MKFDDLARAQPRFELVLQRLPQRDDRIVQFGSARGDRKHRAPPIVGIDVCAHITFRDQSGTRPTDLGFIGVPLHPQLECGCGRFVEMRENTPFRHRQT